MYTPIISINSEVNESIYFLILFKRQHFLHPPSRDNRNNSPKYFFQVTRFDFRPAPSVVLASAASGPIKIKRRLSTM